MGDYRYSQFCPLARAAEIVGERWTLLIVRELLIEPRRFSDLLGPLPGISTSVLADRLVKLERRGVVQRRELPPPAAAVVYELTESGRDLEPAVVELARWGLRHLGPPSPDDHVDPGWTWIGLRSFARRDAGPARAFNLTVPDEARDRALCVRGGPDGTRVRHGHEDADASLTAPTLVLLGLASGGLDPGDAIRSGALRAEGNLESLEDFPALFDIRRREP